MTNPVDESLTLLNTLEVVDKDDFIVLVEAFKNINKHLYFLLNSIVLKGNGIAHCTKSRSTAGEDRIPFWFYFVYFFSKQFVL